MGVHNPKLMAMNKIRIKVEDMYGFRLELSLEDAVLLNQVEERVRAKSKVWWSHEGARGVGWYLQPEVACFLGHELQEENQGIAANIRATFGITPRISNVNLLKKLVRMGIPPQIRPKVWKVMSGQFKKKNAVPEGYYCDLLEEVYGRETKSTKQIENDLHRTFPGHPKVDSPEGRQSLRRILVAYSWRDSRVGYCQGMNFVAAYLYMVLANEEEAFWMLATLLENVLYTDFFSDDLAGTHVEQRVLKDLLTKRLPTLTAHLEDISFDITLVTTEWFLCLFARSFPTETTLRIWDVLFSEGTRVLFRVAMAVFQMKEAELLEAANVGDAMCILQNATHQMYDPDVLMKVAFEKLGPLPMTVISKHRQKQQPAVEAELEERVRSEEAAVAAEEEKRRIREKESNLLDEEDGVWDAYYEEDEESFSAY